MTDRANVEVKANALETLLESGNLKMVKERLQQEAANEPGEFNDVVRAFQQKNAERLQSNGTLPRVTIHEDGGFFGIGSKVDDVKVTVADRSRLFGKATYDVYDSPATLPQESQKPMESASCSSEINGFGQNQPTEVTTLFRAGHNMVRAGNRFGGWHNQESGGVHTRNGEELPRVPRSYLR